MSMNDMVALKLPRDLHDRVKHAAHIKARNKSEWIRMAIEAALNRQSPRHKRPSKDDDVV